jgi:hypothetical protein
MLSSPKVGVLGGGQLGRMLMEAANRLNIQMNVLDTENAPAKQISVHDGHITGSFTDRASLRKLAEACDVLTAEIEHVDTYALEEVASEVKVEPSWKTIRIIQDKLYQKEHLSKFNIPMAEYRKLHRNSIEELTIPSLAAAGPFSALAFLGAHKFNEFIKLMLFNLTIMAEPIERRPTRSRKPKVHFDDQIAQSLGPSKSSRAPKALAKPTAKPLKPPATASTSTEPFASTEPLASTEPFDLDAVEQLCSQTEGLDIEEDPKAKKKAKAAEIARLKGLGLEGVMEEARLPKDVQFEPFDPGNPREPKVNIPSSIDPTDPLALLDLFIPPEIYITIAENTNLYATAHNAPIATTPTN